MSPVVEFCWALIYCCDLGGWVVWQFTGLVFGVYVCGCLAACVSCDLWVTWLIIGVGVLVDGLGCSGCCWILGLRLLWLRDLLVWDVDFGVARCVCLVVWC